MKQRVHFTMSVKSIVEKKEETCSPARDGQCSTPLRLLAVQRGAQAYKWCAIGPNIVLVRAKLTAFSRDSLQLFLRGRVGVSNIHEKSLLSNTHPVVLSNNFIANFAALKSTRHGQ